MYFGVYIFVFFQLFRKVTSTKKKNKTQMQLSQLKDILNHFVNSNGTNVCTIGNGNLEQQTIGIYNDFERIVGNAS